MNINFNLFYQELDKIVSYYEEQPNPVNLSTLQSLIKSRIEFIDLEGVEHLENLKQRLISAKVVPHTPVIKLVEDIASSLKAGALFSDLPDEIILTILSYLDLNDVITNSIVNKRLYTISTDKKLLDFLFKKYSDETDKQKKIIELALNHHAYDKEGNYLALELAKQIENPSLRQKMISRVEQKLLTRQLQNIRSQIKRAIDTQQLQSYPEKRWMMQPEVHRAAIEAQISALKEVINHKDHLTVIYAGQENTCVIDIYQELAKTKQLTQAKPDQALQGAVDVILAPHTLYSEMESIFKASEDLLCEQNPLPIEKHPLFNYFNLLSKEGVFVATLNSGPNVQDFTDLMLDKHELELKKANQSGNPKLKIFNSVETFFRCLDIFKKKYEEKIDKTIDCNLSFSMPHISLESYCRAYIKQYPELASMNTQQREKFIRLLSAFNVGNDIVELNITLQMSVKKKEESTEPHSFKPIFIETNDLLKSGQQIGSNEISFAQQNLSRQIQNLNGSELSMPFIKDADGAAQFKALKRIISNKEIKLVDIGGGRGETNAIPKAIQEAGATVRLLNIEPHEPFARPYIEAHQAVGIKDVQVLQQKAQLVSSADVKSYFQGEKVDALFVSHVFYFLLGEIHKASLTLSTPLDKHPLWKYFDMVREDGVFVVTLQSGAGARLFRNALLGNHGLNPPTSPIEDEIVPILSSFGNLATFLRHFEVFRERYKKETGKKINIKMHHSVANVPLGGFKVEQDPETGGYIIHNPNGKDDDPNWLAPRMLDFYGNWKELQILATLTPERVNKIPEELKKLGLENPTPEIIAAKRESALKMQETFLHILRVFAPAEENMQHPNITLEITIES